MFIRHSARLAAALIAGATLAMGGPAFAARNAHETVTEVIPQAPGAATPVPAFPLWSADGAAPPAAVVPAATIPAAPQRLGASGAVAGLVRQADAALKARHTAAAGERLEQAETALLNARTDGLRGYRIQVQDISAARGALATGNLGAAQREVAQLMQTLDHPAA
ncbi:hypothetical protein [Plastoroseomonas hellenica]|uniref:hypothetical protein n=1 Tax=Plastoroseomonas hellenica TaxID=2687306 RepID=UPI001BABCBD5|nr:hypothetical protein [Plastoroseomonas hellenica]MBR0641755.1 hypothetical protein [Plastoroseomonas hellenica]